ncbi:putative leader peptide [Phaeacidiphilus oryzae]
MRRAAPCRGHLSGRSAGPARSRSAALCGRRHVDLLRVSSALCRR